MDGHLFLVLANQQGALTPFLIYNALQNQAKSLELVYQALHEDLVDHTNEFYYKSSSIWTVTSI